MWEPVRLALTSVNPGAGPRSSSTETSIAVRLPTATARWAYMCPAVTARPYEGSCFDCPARRRCVLESIVRGGRPHCAFESAKLGARARLPAEWSERYSMALVRRGAVARIVTDPSGEEVAIDLATAGTLIALGDRPIPVQQGYAVCDTLICPLTIETERALIESGGNIARDLSMLERDAATRVERISHAKGASSARAKVARVLAFLLDAFAPADVIPAWVQQRDIAALAGVRHETACRVLKALTEERTIAVREEGTAVGDRQRLDLCS